MEPPPLKNLIMELEVKYLFSASSPGTIFYIYHLPKGLEIRKYWNMVLEAKESTNQGGILLDYHNILWSK